MLKQQAVRSGAFLAARQAVALAIHFPGVLLLTRVIGPAGYGTYAGALAVYVYTLAVANCGIGTHLIRQPGETLRDYDQASSLLAIVGAVGAAVAFALAPVMQQWVRVNGLAEIFRALLVVFPLQLLVQVPMARLERALNYRRVALNEVLGYAVFYGVALPCAFRGRGPWSAVAGYWCQQIALAALYFHGAAYRPRWFWASGAARRMLQSGLGYASSTWIWQLRDLVNPLIVGHYLGAVAVGYVALAVRLVDTFGFMKNATWRLSIAVLSRVQSEPARLVRAMTEGMPLLAIAVGPLLAGLAGAVPWIIPTFFGPAWTGVGEILPFIALGFLTNTLFVLHTSSLYVVRRSAAVALFHAVHVLLFAGSALLLVPRYGLIGYGWSEVAALFSYPLLHVNTARFVGAPSYRFAAPWWLGLTLPLFSHWLGWWCLLGPFAALLWPGSVRESRRYMADFMGMMHAR